MKYAIVSSKELGTNCWLPQRFIETSERCQRWDRCKYPEKARCKARQAEIAYHESMLKQAQAKAEQERQAIAKLKAGG